MSVKKIAVRILRYLFLGFFVCALMAVLYGVKKFGRERPRIIFEEGVKV